MPESQRALRNVFATQLSAAGTVRAIIATGGAAALAEALRDQGDIYDVTRALRAHDPHTALFARTPSLRFPRPG